MIGTHFLTHLFECALFYWLKLIEITYFSSSHFSFNGSLFRFCNFQQILSLVNSGVCVRKYIAIATLICNALVPAFTYFILLFQISFLRTLFCIILEGFLQKARTFPITNFTCRADSFFFLVPSMMYVKGRFWLNSLQV